MSDKMWEPRLPTRERPLESAAAKAVYARQAEIATERERCAALIKAAGEERVRLEKSLKELEASRDTAAAGVAGDIELSAAGAVNKILTLKSVEGSLNQQRDSIAKLAAAEVDAGKKLRALRVEDDKLAKEIVVLFNLKKFENAAKHFKTFVQSWQDAEADHQEVCRLLGELHTDGVDIKGLMKSAGVEEKSLFGQVAQSSFMNTKHSIADFSIEWNRGGKAAVPGNVFYRGGERSRVQQGTSDFRKGNAFGGGVKFQTN
jgi:hypothetical protein